MELIPICPHCDFIIARPIIKQITIEMWIGCDPYPEEMFLVECPKCEDDFEIMPWDYSMLKYWENMYGLKQYKDMWE